jgi:hypothetical protein
MALESLVEQDSRWNDLIALQQHYADFRDFYYDCSVDLLGFVPTEQQLDIAAYVAYGPQYAMVQAQRGEAKTTITGCYAVWTLIHHPPSRVLIVSAGNKMAKQISKWCIQIITGMPELTCMQVDKTHPGASYSIEAYDIHHTLKGPEKSPSIAVLGITSTAQGYRADLLIPDDVESAQNSDTQHKREYLKQLTRDFTSINTNGRIIYLGTPQSVDSIYNDLPARGFDIRIWPGRYPTHEEEARYGGRLAPLIVKAMEANTSLRIGGGPLGERGQVTDPTMMSEAILTKKEVDQGKPYFNLQHMLDTSLSDADRFPLKVKDLLFYSFDLEDAPKKFIWSNDPACQIHHTVGCSIKDSIYRPARVSDEFLPYTYRLISVDPAGGGQNGDETGVSVLFANSCGWIALMSIHGIPGGTEPSKLQQIVDLARKWGVHDVIVEKNFGFGAYANALKAAAADPDPEKGWPMSIEEVWSAGQKELRIMDALEPVMGSHKLIINTSVLQQDVDQSQRYALEKRSLYQFLFQMKYLTRDRKSLVHDDRLESVSQGVSHLIRVIAQQNNQKAQAPVDRFKGFQKNARGIWQFAHRVAAPAAAALPTLMGRFKR